MSASASSSLSRFSIGATQIRRPKPTPIRHQRRYLQPWCALLSALALALLWVYQRPALASPHAQAVDPSVSSSGAQTQPPATKPASVLGTVQTINGAVLSIKADSGALTEVTVQENARLLRIEPGQKTLAGATPFSLSDLKAGDRVLARGTSSPGGRSLAALQLVAIKQADIAHKQSAEQADWQRRGVSGLVKSIDPATGTITISSGISGSRSVDVHAQEKTSFRRYAPGSVNYSDTQPSTLAEIKPGDQVRARGEKSADGQALQAEEIVSGAFRNIAGTITAVDPSASTLTVTDLVTRKPVVVSITPQSQLKRLDPQVAQRIAMRLKGGGPGAGAGERSGSPAQRPETGPAAAGQDADTGPATRGSASDAQQMLARAASITLADLHKDSMVVLVATGGAAHGPTTAVTLLTGVEPMLQASASGSEAILSSAWSLGGGAGGGAPGGAEGPQP